LDWELRQNLTSLAARYGADLGAHSAAVVPFLPYRQADAEQMHALWLRREQARAAAAAVRAAAAAAAAATSSAGAPPPPGALMLSVDTAPVAALLTDPAYVRYSWDQKRYMAVLAAVRQQRALAGSRGVAVGVDGEAALAPTDDAPMAADEDLYANLRRRVPEYAIERGARQIEPRLSESPLARLQDTIAEVTSAAAGALNVQLPPAPDAPSTCGESLAAVALRYGARPDQLVDAFLARPPPGGEVKLADAGRRLLAAIWRHAAASLGDAAALAPEAQLARALARAAARGAAWPPLRTLAVDALPCTAAACGDPNESPGSLRIRMCALTPRLVNSAECGGAAPLPAIDEACALQPLFSGSLV